MLVEFSDRINRSINKVVQFGRKKPRVETRDNKTETVRSSNCGELK